MVDCYGIQYNAGIIGQQLDCYVVLFNVLLPISYVFDSFVARHESLPLAPLGGYCCIYTYIYCMYTHTGF